MNIPILIVSIIMTVAVVAHIIGGTRETATLEPSGKTGRNMAHFVQAMCAFQMLTLDLIIVTVLLYLLALSDLLPEPRWFALGLAAYFTLQALIWVSQVLWLARPGATLLSLPHWTIWLLCAALMLLGA